MQRSKSRDRDGSGGGAGKGDAGLYMNKSEMGAYLHDLRNNRPSRPTGARPPPSSFVSKRFSTSHLNEIKTEASVSDRVNDIKDESIVPPRCASAQSFRKRSSITTPILEQNERKVSTMTAGRPLARPPGDEHINTDTALEAEVIIEEELPYLERGQRWLERQEAHSLRLALEDMDTAQSTSNKTRKTPQLSGEEEKMQEERRVFDAAQSEAAELVWKHQNPHAPFQNPDVTQSVPQPIRTQSPAVNYREHMRKGSVHSRTASWNQTAIDIQARQMKRRSRESSASRSVSGGSKSSSQASSRVASDGSLKIPGSPITPAEVVSDIEDVEARGRKVQFKEEPEIVVKVANGKEKDSEVAAVGRGLRRLMRSVSPSKALHAGSASAVKEKDNVSKSETTTHESSTSHDRVPSISAAAKTAASAVPSHFRNPFSRARESKGRLSRMSTDPLPVSSTAANTGVAHKVLPTTTPTVTTASSSANTLPKTITTTSSLPAASKLPFMNRIEIQRNPPSQSRNPLYTVNNAAISEEVLPSVEESVKMKDGLEIRSDELRKATSASLRDRSPKLPTPTVVSDKPGRPIVSFQKDWKPKEVEMPEPLVSSAPVSNHASRTSTELPPSLRIGVGQKTADTNRPLPKQPHGSTAPPAAQKPSPVLRKKGPIPAAATTGSASSSMQVPGRERERTSPPPAPLVHAASEPVVPTLRSDIPMISVNGGSTPGGMPIPEIAVNGGTPGGRPIPQIAVSDAPAPGSVRSRANGWAQVRSQEQSRRMHDSGRGGTSHSSIPTINVGGAPSAPPSIAISAPASNVRTTPTSPAPTIAVNGSSSAPQPPRSTRPLPTPSTNKNRPNAPFPLKHAATDPVSTHNTRPQSHITPTGSSYARQTGALCASCGLPISGRILSAANARFHPECFRCHHCSEGLECVAFYPEPESARLARVNRIRDRQAGLLVDAGEGKSEADDGYDETQQRFYCHLDYHEFFSPRCRSCKTPIEGEVVVACGGEWHVGHFFCAQCGDPFDDATPFVERDGYAWCVGCHTNRYSTKCSRCRKPVVEMVVKALGKEWHGECFCCSECGSGFEDGQYFIRPGGDEPFCPACEERRLKA